MSIATQQRSSRAQQPLNNRVLQPPTNRVPHPLLSRQPRLNQPPDEATRQTSKLYFKLIQAIHHKEIIDKAISDRRFPSGMMRQVNRLTNFIKPSSPTDYTAAQVLQNTQQWMNNNMNILQIHYQTIIESLTQPPNTFNTLALHIAVGWAHKRYTHKLTHTTITTVETILNSSLETHYRQLPRTTLSYPTTELPFPSASPQPITTLAPGPLEQQQNPWHTASAQIQAPPQLNSLPTTSAPVPFSPTLEDFPPLPKLSPPGKPQASQKRSSPLGLRPAPAQCSVNQKLNNQHPPLPQTQSSTEIGIRTSTPSSPVAPSQTQIDVSNIALNNSPPHSKNNMAPTPPLSPKAKGKEIIRTPTSTSPHDPQRVNNPWTTQEHSIPSIIGPPSPTIDTNLELTTTNTSNLIQAPVEFHHRACSQPETLSAIATLPNPLVNTPTTKVYKHSNVSVKTLERISPLSLSPTGGARSGGETRTGQFQGQMMIKGQSNEQQPKNNQSEPLQKDIMSLPVRDPCITGASTYPPQFEFQPQPQPQPQHQPPTPATLQKPSYHKARPKGKVADWNFKGYKPILVLGDSNVNRIPPFHNPNIQVDSYPGATFYHFTRVLEKTEIHVDTSVVVLSVGINNMDNDPYKTSIKQIASMHKEARLTFPNAIIYIPIINHSHLLSPDQKRNLKVINGYITTHGPFLLEIPHDEFHTTSDRIHWTTTTADLIFKNWCEQLNLE